MKLHDLAQMQDFARKLAHLLKRGDVVCLNGEMGAGKTTLVQMIAKELGVREAVVSPTFSLVNEYASLLGTIYHLDFYRMQSDAEIYDIDYETMLYYPQGITFLEWSERILDFLPREYIEINITRGQGEERRISIPERGVRSEEIRKVFDE